MMSGLYIYLYIIYIYASYNSMPGHLQLLREQKKIIRRKGTKEEDVHERENLFFSYELSGQLG